MPESDADTDSVSVSAWVTEPTTQLREELTWTLAAGSSALQTRVTIHNPTQGIQRFAHWVNVPFVPGGENQLTDNTEFIIPTKRVNVSERHVVHAHTLHATASPQCTPAVPPCTYHWPTCVHAPFTCCPPRVPQQSSKEGSRTVEPTRQPFVSAVNLNLTRTVVS